MAPLRATGIGRWSARILLPGGTDLHRALAEPGRPHPHSRRLPGARLPCGPPSPPPTSAQPPPEPAADPTPTLPTAGTRPQTHGPEPAIPTEPPPNTASQQRPTTPRNETTAPTPPPDPRHRPRRVTRQPCARRRAVGWLDRAVREKSLRGGPRRRPHLPTRVPDSDAPETLIRRVAERSRCNVDQRSAPTCSWRAPARPRMRRWNPPLPNPRADAASGHASGTQPRVPPAGHQRKVAARWATAPPQWPDQGSRRVRGRVHACPPAAAARLHRPDARPAEKGPTRPRTRPDDREWFRHYDDDAIARDVSVGSAPGQEAVNRARPEGP